MMAAYARWLFGTAAAFNFAVGFGLFFLRSTLFPLLGLAPASGTDVVLLALVCMFIVLFGCAYACAAMDPVKYRPYIALGVAGKLSAVVIAGIYWTTGVLDFRLPMLAGGDLLFAALFVDFLRRNP